MLVNTEHDLFDTVYIKCDLDQLPRQILSIHVKDTGVTYETQLVRGMDLKIAWCYSAEISKEKDTVLATTN